MAGYEEFQKYSNKELIKLKRAAEKNLEDLGKEVKIVKYLAEILAQELKERLKDLQYDEMEAQDDRIEQRWEQTNLH